MSGCELAFPVDGYEARPLDAGPGDAGGQGDGDVDVDAAVPGLVQWTSVSGSDTTQLVVALPKSAAVGSALVLVAISDQTAPTSVTSAGVTWNVALASSKQVALAMWVGFVPLGGSSTVTVRWAASPARSQTTALAHLSEWNDFAAVGTKIASSGTGGVGPITTGTLTATDGTVMLLAAAGGHTQDIELPTSGFTPMPFITLADYRLDLAYVHAPSPRDYSTTWKYPSTRGWEALLVSFTR